MPTQWQVSDGKALCPKKTLRLLSLCFLPPSSSSCFCKKHSPQASVSFLRKQKETAPSLTHDFNFIHAYSNLGKKRDTIRPCHHVTGLVMAWHLGPIWSMQLGPKCQLHLLPVCICLCQSLCCPLW